MLRISGEHARALHQEAAKAVGDAYMSHSYATELADFRHELAGRIMALYSPFAISRLEETLDMRKALFVKARGQYVATVKNLGSTAYHLLKSDGNSGVHYDELDIVNAAGEAVVRQESPKLNDHLNDRYNSVARSYIGKTPGLFGKARAAVRYAKGHPQTPQHRITHGYNDEAYGAVMAEEFGRFLDQAQTTIPASDADFSAERLLISGLEHTMGHSIDGQIHASAEAFDELNQFFSGAMQHGRR